MSSDRFKSIGRHESSAANVAGLLPGAPPAAQAPPSSERATTTTFQNRFETIGRAIFLLLLLYLFLVAIQLFGGAIKSLGAGAASISAAISSEAVTAACAPKIRTLSSCRSRL